MPCSFMPILIKFQSVWVFNSFMLTSLLMQLPQTPIFTKSTCRVRFCNSKMAHGWRRLTLEKIRLGIPQIWGVSTDFL